MKIESNTQQRPSSTREQNATSSMLYTKLMGSFARPQNMASNGALQDKAIVENGDGTTTTYKYEGQNVTHWETVDQNGNIVNVFDSTNDENGISDVYTTSEAQYTYKYNEYGQIVRVLEDLKNDGTIDTIYEDEYDESGRTTRTKIDHKSNDKLSLFGRAIKDLFGDVEKDEIITYVYSQDNFDGLIPKAETEYGYFNLGNE